MKTGKMLMVLVLLLSLATTTMAAGPGNGGGGNGGGSGGGHTEIAGNNLSYPVIWSEEVQKVVPGTVGMTPQLEGVWWYQWGTNGTDPDVVPASCAPDPDEANTALNPTGAPFCDDNIPSSLSKPAGEPPADNPLPLARAYVQKDQNNVWRAWDGSATEGGVANLQGGVDIDWIDWGDNLESNDWYTRSQVRTEVVLFKDLPTVMLEYEMRHTSGWGIDEVHGLAADLDMTARTGPGTRATVYSHCARLTIQKLLVSRDDPRLADLIWVPGEGWTEPEGYPIDLINPHIFNGSVHEGGDGPGYYSAEINVKGRIIYGYTWNVRDVHDDTPLPGSTIPTAAGDYRITFSFDQQCDTASLATYFVEGTTQIIVPLETEEVETITAEGDEGTEPSGAIAMLRPAVFDETGAMVDGNLTYMDVHILERGGGNGGGKGGRTSAFGCDCLCECEGEECNCTCAEQCECNCACQDGECDCDCGTSECAQFQARIREMEHYRTQLQSQCPGEGCPCTDHQGNACQQYQEQLTNTANAMHQLQFQTCCDGEECLCVCQSGDACPQVQTQLETLIQLQEELMTRCETGDCETETEFFTILSAALTDMANMLDMMEQSFLVYLPSVQLSE